jgi:hypothetical protein
MAQAVSQRIKDWIMRCKKMERLISRYAHQECTPEEVRQVSQHLASCPACEKVFLEFQALANAARSMESPPLTEAQINALYLDTLRKMKQSGRPGLTRKQRLTFKPAWTFAIIAILVVGTGILSRSYRPVPELIIRENMTLSEIRKLESQFQDKRIRSKWMDQPIPTVKLIGLLKEMRRLDRRYGSVAPRLEETLERIVAETNPAPEKGIPISFEMGAFTLNQSIEYIHRIRRYQSEITMRELAALYAQVRRT